MLTVLFQCVGHSINHHLIIRHPLGGLHVLRQTIPAEDVLWQFTVSPIVASMTW